MQDELFFNCTCLTIITAKKYFYQKPFCLVSLNIIKIVRQYLNSYKFHALSFAFFLKYYYSFFNGII